MGVYIEGLDMPKGETTELIIRIQPNGEIRDLHEILLKARAEDIDLVRCGECKYVGTDATCCLVCCRDGMGLKPYNVYHDDFCSYGERRE